MKQQVVVFLFFFGLAIAAPHHSKEESSSSESHEKDDHMRGNGTESHGHENGTEHHGGPDHGPEHNGTDLEHNGTMHGEAPRAKRDWQNELTNKITGGAAEVQQWANTAEKNTQNWLQNQGQQIEQGFNTVKNNLTSFFNNMNNQNNGQMNWSDMSKNNYTNLQPFSTHNGQIPPNNGAGLPQIQTFPNSNPSGSSSFGMSSANGGQIVFPNQATGSQANGNQLGLQPNIINGQNPAVEFIKNNIAVSASPTAPQWVIQTSKPWWKFWGN